MSDTCMVCGCERDNHGSQPHVFESSESEMLSELCHIRSLLEDIKAILEKPSFTLSPDTQRSSD